MSSQTQTPQKTPQNRTDAAVITPTHESTAIIQVIERAALNPDVDIDKMKVEKSIDGRSRVFCWYAVATPSCFSLFRASCSLIAQTASVSGSFDASRRAKCPACWRSASWAWHAPFGSSPRRRACRQM